ncbi:MAG: hypothetical protein LBQ60_08010 [Bacteroidales bacterium]|jgi:uroporphyrinogen decarboxylase|nr:hypothetical protein [Bacteroidales bacterium]
MRKHPISRRTFVKSGICAGTGLLATGLGTFTSCKKKTPNKRDLVLEVLDMSTPNKYIPAAFFMHFGKEYRSGQAAVNRHLEYFRTTDMDFVKVQYELGMPKMELQKASDWEKIPVFREDFFEPMLTLISGIVKEAKAEALIIPTVYSPFMCASQMTGGKKKLLEQIHEHPDAVAKGMEIITESLLFYIRESIRAGVDGFYMSTQGGEVNRIPDAALFDKVVRPFDMALMTEADEKCAFNILHICDYEGKYNSLAPYVSYPGKVVNTPVVLADGTTITSKDAAVMFKRPVMGGLNRLHEIAKGTPEKVIAAADNALKAAPANYIFGADCTVPAGTDWNLLRSVIQQAHHYRM